MKYWIGTSGFQYAEWKGSFYPEDLPAAKMLPFYAVRFNTTEVNYTFHRIPAPQTIANWCQLTAETFRFTLKAPQKVTHFARLRNCGDTVDYFYDVVNGLGSRLGPVLFQLPPNLKKDAPLLEHFTESLPASMRAAFEFRHESWLDEEIFALLRKRNVCLCIADTEETSTPLVATAKWGYLRLRREDYVESDIRKWGNRISAQPWKNAFVYFKHEDEGKGPAYASLLMSLLRI